MCPRTQSTRCDHPAGDSPNQARPTSRVLIGSVSRLRPTSIATHPAECKCPFRWSRYPACKSRTEAAPSPTTDRSRPPSPGRPSPAACHRRLAEPAGSTSEPQQNAQPPGDANELSQTAGTPQQAPAKVSAASSVGTNQSWNPPKHRCAQHNFSRNQQYARQQPGKTKFTVVAVDRAFGRRLLQRVNLFVDIQ